MKTLERDLSVPYFGGEILRLWNTLGSVVKALFGLT